MTKYVTAPTARTNENYFTVGEIIRRCRELNIDLGRGNPYNTLRYYTKIGLLPHMLRRKTSPDANGTSGHYPASVLDILRRIAELKAQNFNNDQIKEVLADEADTHEIPTAAERELPPHRADHPLHRAVPPTGLHRVLHRGWLGSTLEEQPLWIHICLELLTWFLVIGLILFILFLLVLGLPPLARTRLQQDLANFSKNVRLAIFQPQEAKEKISKSIVEIGDVLEYTAPAKEEVIARKAFIFPGLEAEQVFAREANLGTLKIGESLKTPEVDVESLKILGEEILYISSIGGVSNKGGDIDLVAGKNITITPNDAANAITISSTAAGGGTAEDANTLDSLDSSQFLRSDTSDSFTSGTLTFNAGTTLSILGDLSATGAVTLGNDTAAVVISATNFDLTSGGAVTLTGNLTLSSDANEGISGGGLSDCDLETQTLGWDSATNKFVCLGDEGAAGAGDNVFVNSTAATDANFINTTATGTTAGVTFSLNTVSTPDDISLTISNASAAEAGVVTTGAQTLAGAKTFSGSIIVSGDTINDFTGTGLVMSGNSLTTTLGTSISNAELDNDTINFDKIASSLTLDETTTISAAAALNLNIGNNITLQVSGTGVINASDLVNCTNCIGPTEISVLTLGSDTDGAYVATITAGNGLTGDGTGEGSTPTLAVNTGSGIQIVSDNVALGPLSANWDQTGAFDIVLNNAGSELVMLESAGAFTGTLDVGDLSASAVYTFSGATGTVLTSVNYSGTLDSIYVNVGESPAAGDISGSFSGGLQINDNTIGDAELANTISYTGALTVSDLTISDTNVPLTGGDTTFELNAAATRTLTITNPNAGNVANLSVEGSVSAVSVIVSGDTINDFTGTGLVMSGNFLTASLGTSIETGEITDGTITGDDINSNLAGSGLVLTAGTPDTLDVNAGNGLEIVTDVLRVNQGFSFSWTADHTFMLAGAEDLAITHDGTGGAVNVLNVTVTPSATAGVMSGISISQADSANTNPLDAALYLNNLDADLAIPAAIQIANTGGGGYTDIFNVLGTGISATEFNVLDAEITLGTETAGAYVDNVTGGAGITVTGSSGEGWEPDVVIDLDDVGADGATTSSVSGLEFDTGELTLIRGCAAGGILEWDNTNFEWDCGVDDTGGGGANSFETIVSTGENVVAESATDILTLAVTGTNLSIAGTASSDTLTFDISESTLAGSGLGVSTDALVVNTANGVTVSGDNVVLDLNYNPTWTNEHTWTLAGAEDLVIGNTTAAAGNVVDLSFTTQNNTTGLALAATSSADATADTIQGLSLSWTESADSDTFNAINIANTTATNSTATAISIGTGWDTGIRLNSGGISIQAGSGIILASGALAINTSSGITSNQATLTIDASGTVEIKDNLTITTGTTISAASVTSMTVGAAFTLNGTSYVRIGDTNTPGVATGDDALYVEGALEVDGATTFDGTVTANTDVTLVFEGTQDLAITHDGTGGAVNVVNVTVTPSATAGVMNGISISQADSANTNPLDAALYINNADANLTIPAAIQIANTGAGGTPYTDIFNVLGTGISATEFNVLDAEITLGTETAGAYVDNVTGGAGITVTGSSGEGWEPDVVVDLLDSADGTSGVTSSFSGLEFQGGSSDELTLLQGCGANEILKWDDTNSWWYCAVDATGGAGANSFETMNAPAGTDPQAESATDTLNLVVAGAPDTNFTITGNSTTDTLTFDIVESVLAGNGLTYATDVLAVGAGNGITANADSITLDLGNSLAVATGLQVDANGLSLIETCTDNYTLKWTDAGGWACAIDQTGGGGANSFETMDTPAGTDPVAESATDTLQWLVAGAPDTNLTITGDATNDRITLDIVESVLAGSGLGTSTDALVVNTANGITVSGDNVVFDLSYAAAWTASHSWTSTITNTGSQLDVNTTLGNDADVDTVSGITVDMTSAANEEADVLYAINIGNVTNQPNPLEYAIRIGSGWQELFDVNGTLISAAEFTVLDAEITLGSETAGAYVDNVTGGAGITVTGSSGEGWEPDVVIDLDDVGADGATTSSVSGLEFDTGELTLIRGCAAGGILEWDNTNFEWDCGVDDTGGGGANSFETMNAPAGTDPVAESAIDILNLVVAGAPDTNFTITGNETTDTLTFDIVESVLAGSGLGVSTDALVVNTGNGLEINTDAVRVNQDFSFSWTADHTYTLAGAEDVAITHDGTGGTVNVVNVTVTPSATAGALWGIAVTQANSANTNPLDAALSILNDDSDLTITDAIRITYSAVGYTNLLNTPSIDISGAGAITGATGVSTTTLDASSTATFTGNITANDASADSLLLGSSTDTVTINGDVSITDTNWSISAAGAIVGVGVNSGTGLIQGTGGLTITGTVSINDSASTNTTSIGGGTTTGSITIGGTGTQTLAIGNGAGIKTVQLGSNNTTSTTTILSGTTSGALALNDTAGGALTNIGTGTTTGTVTIGGSGTQTISIGNDAAGVKTVNLGSSNSTAATTIRGGGGILINSSINATVGIGVGTSTGTVTIGGTGTQTLAIGNGAGVKTVNLGSSNTTSGTTILSGSGGLTITGGAASTWSLSSGALTIASGTDTNLTLNAAGTGGLVFTGYDCSGLGNGGKLTADASGNISCAADISGGGALTVRESDLAPSVSSVTTLEFGPAATSEEEFIVTDQTGGVARVVIGTKVGKLNEAETVTGGWTFNTASTTFTTAIDVNTASTIAGLTVDGGSLTLSGLATDITTGTGESLVIVANGAGIVDIQDSLTVDSITVDTAGITITTGALAVNSDSITSDGSLTIDATSTVIIPAADTFQTDDITSGNAAITIDSGTANSITFGSADVLNISGNISQTGATSISTGTSGLTVNGLATFNTDADFTLAEAENIVITNTASGTTAVDLLSSTLTNNTTSGTQRSEVISIGGSGTTEAGLTINYTGAVASGLTSGMIIAGTSTGTIATAIDLTDAEIGTGIALGVNDITGTTAAITFTNFTVSTAGAIVGVGVNSGTGLIQGTGGLTITGAAVSLNVSSNFAVNIATGTSTGAVTIGGTGTQTIAIGNGAGVKTVNLGSSNTTSTTTLLSGSGGILLNDAINNPVSIGTGTSTGTVTIGGTGTQTISIGNGAGIKTVNLGSSNTTSGTTILSGSTGLTITGGGASTWSTSNGGLTVQSGSGTLSLGTTTTLTASSTLTINATNTVFLGDGTNGLQVDETWGASSGWSGNARPTRKITLVPEFPGAVLTGDGAANSGTMKSDFCSGTARRSINTGICTVTTEEHNYYSWTANATNDYDIWLRWQVPSDFNALIATNPIVFYGWRTSTSDTVTLTIYNPDGTVCGTATSISGTVATWNTTNYSSAGCSPTADNVLLFRVSLSVGVDSEFARIGEIEISYRSRF